MVASFLVEEPMTGVHPSCVFQLFDRIRDRNLMSRVSVWSKSAKLLELRTDTFCVREIHCRTTLEAPELPLPGCILFPAVPIKDGGVGQHCRVAESNSLLVSRILLPMFELPSLLLAGREKREMRIDYA